MNHFYILNAVARNSLFFAVAIFVFTITGYGALFGQTKLPDFIPEPVAALSEDEVARDAAILVIRHRVSVVYRTGSSTVSKSAARRLKLDRTTTDKVRGEFSEFSNYLKGFTERAKKQLSSQPDSAKEVAATLLSELSLRTKEYSKRLKATVGDDAFLELKKIIVEDQIAQRGLAILLTRELSSKLGLTKEQLSSIKQLEALAQNEIRESMREIRADSQEKMLQQLNPDQQEIVDRFLAGEFKFD